MSARRLVEGVRVVDDRADNGRLIVDGGDRRVVVSGQDGLDAIVRTIQLPTSDQQALLGLLEGLPGGADVLATLDEAGLVERCDHLGPGRALAQAAVPRPLEQFLSRTLSCSRDFPCRHAVLDRLAGTRVWAFGAVDALPGLAEALAANGLSPGPRPVSGDDIVLGLSVADLDGDDVCPLPPEGLPPGLDWLRVGVSAARGIVEIGPLWEAELHTCHDCFVAGWPPPGERAGGPDPGQLPAGTLGQVATARVVTELAALLAHVPRARSIAGWCRFDVAAATEEELVVPQRADCPTCGGGDLACTINADPSVDRSVARFEERYIQRSLTLMAQRQLDLQMERGDEAKTWGEGRRADLRAIDGGYLQEAARPWHRSRPDPTAGLGDLLEAATSPLDRLELACSLAVGLLARPGSSSDLLRRSAPSGGDIREYLIVGVPTSGGDPDGSTAQAFWFDDVMCRLRRVCPSDEPLSHDAVTAGGGDGDGAPEDAGFWLMIVTDPQLLVHKYLLHGLRVAYLDAGAAAYCLLTALRGAGFSRCALVEPDDWSGVMERFGLSADLWRLGTGVKVAW